jgi:hypothetical protein
MANGVSHSGTALPMSVISPGLEQPLADVPLMSFG